MSKCDACGREMLKADGCNGTTMSHVMLLDPDNYIVQDAYTTFRRERVQPHEANHGRCMDCAAKIGKMHHPGCDWERCPKCGGQLISCDCGPVKEWGSPSSLREMKMKKYHPMFGTKGWRARHGQKPIKMVDKRGDPRLKGILE